MALVVTAVLGLVLILVLGIERTELFGSAVVVLAMGALVVAILNIESA